MVDENAFLLNAVRDEQICSFCKHSSTDRIPRNWLVKLLFGWLPVKRYMCYKCKRKYHTIEKRN
jgi:hypothetical protein